MAQRSIKWESFGLPRSLGTGTCMLLTGIGAFGLGWLSSVLYPCPYGENNSSPYGSPPSGNQDQESYQESEYEQDNVSEFNTPRSGFRRTSPRRTNTGINFDSKSHIGAQFKQVILIRTDVEMVRPPALDALTPRTAWMSGHSCFAGGRQDSCTILSRSSGSCKEGLEIQSSCLQSLGMKVLCSQHSFVSLVHLAMHVPDMHFTS